MDAGLVMYCARKTVSGLKGVRQNTYFYSYRNIVLSKSIFLKFYAIPLYIEGLLMLAIASCTVCWGF